MIEIEINRIVEKAVAKTITVSEAVERILSETGRGSRILIVDENAFDLATELTNLGYTVDRVLPGTSDGEIKLGLWNKVLVTANGKDFVDDVETYRYGLLWIPAGADAKALARKIEKVLMSSNFRRNLMQVVKL